MANKYKGEIGFEAGGEQFVLRFSANAIVNIEDAFDKSISKIGESMRDPDMVRMADMRRMFCIGLMDHYAETGHPMEEERAKQIFSQIRPVDATTLVTRAFNAAFGAGDEGGQEAPAPNPPPPAGEAAAESGTGTIS